MRYKGIFVVNLCLFLFSLHFFVVPTLANSIPDRNHSSLSVSSSVPADGQTTAIITVTLQDSSGNPVVGNTVTLEDSNNSGATITTISGTTDVSGHALFSIKSTKNQTDNINVKDTTSNITFYNLGQITFTTVGCYDPPPGSSPRLTSAVAKGSSQIVLTWTDAANPVTRYLLSYGLAQGQYIYGNPNIGGQGTTSYTVGSLSPGKKYYFVIQAINGCTPGNFSNEVSAIAGGGDFVNTQVLTQTPTTGISPTINSTSSSISVSPTLNVQDIQPTAIPLPTQVSTAGDSKSEIFLAISIGIVVMGSVGNFLYWKHKEHARKTYKHLNYIEENQEL